MPHSVTTSKRGVAGQLCAGWCHADGMAWSATPAMVASFVLTLYPQRQCLRLLPRLLPPLTWTLAPKPGKVLSCPSAAGTSRMFAEKCRFPRCLRYIWHSPPVWTVLPLRLWACLEPQPQAKFAADAASHRCCCRRQGAVDPPGL